MTKAAEPKGQPLPSDIVALSFEDAMAELERIVRQLEDGRAKLDDAIGAYERGAMLRHHCETLLRAAQARVEVMTTDGDGAVRMDPL